MRQIRNGDNVLPDWARRGEPRQIYEYETEFRNVYEDLRRIPKEKKEIHKRPVKLKTLRAEAGLDLKAKLISQEQHRYLINIFEILENEYRVRETTVLQTGSQMVGGITYGFSREAKARRLMFLFNEHNRMWQQHMDEVSLRLKENWNGYLRAAK